MTYRQMPAPEWDEGHTRDTVSERLQQLSSDDVERILERAIGLQMDSSAPGRDVIDADALGRIADELGIDSQHLQQAMAEELVRIEEEDPGWLSRNLMPKAIAESRTVAAAPDRVRAVLDYWLASNEGLRKHTGNMEGATWHRDGNPIAAIKTAFNLAQGDGSLRSARSVCPRKNGWSARAVVSSSSRWTTVAPRTASMMSPASFGVTWLYSVSSGSRCTSGPC